MLKTDQHGEIITLKGAELLLDPAGLLIWPEKRLAVVSDLHLGKGSYFARHGQMLPPYDSEETLVRLLSVLENREIDKLILLGDSVHDEGAWARLSSKERQLFQTLTDRYDVIWILGNHERGFVPPGVSATVEESIDSLIFRHEAEADVKPDTIEVSGHYHPKAVVATGRTKLRRPCFLIGSGRLILPAFGSFTGGLSALDPAITALFPMGFDSYLTGDRIVTVPHHKLLP